MCFGIFLVFIIRNAFVLVTQSIENNLVTHTSHLCLQASSTSVFPTFGPIIVTHWVRSLRKVHSPLFFSGWSMMPLKTFTSNPLSPYFEGSV